MSDMTSKCLWLLIAGTIGYFIGVWYPGPGASLKSSVGL